MNLPDNSTLLADKKAGEYARLIRPHVSLIPLGIYSALLWIHGAFELLPFILGWVLLVSSYGAVVVLNDIADIDIDRANKRRDTPLAIGTLTKQDAHKALLICVLVGVCAAIFIHPLGIIWLLSYLALGWAYSGPLALKNKGYLAVLILGFCYGVMPWLLGIIVSNSIINVNTLIILVSSFIFTTGIISLKDFKDVKGDKKHEKRTILVKKGPRYTQIFIVVMSSSAFAPLLTLTALQANWLALIAGVILLLYTAMTLKSPSMLHSPHFRSSRGSLIRILFFIYAIIIYCVVVFSM